MLSWMRSWIRDRRARKVVRQAIAGMRAMEAELAEEAERDRGKWRCGECDWIGIEPRPASET